MFREFIIFSTLLVAILSSPVEREVNAEAQPTVEDNVQLKIRDNAESPQNVVPDITDLQEYHQVLERQEDAGAHDNTEIQHHMEDHYHPANNKLKRQDEPENITNPSDCVKSCEEDCDSSTHCQLYDRSSGCMDKCKRDCLRRCQGSNNNCSPQSCSSDSCSSSGCSTSNCCSPTPIVGGGGEIRNTQDLTASVDITNTVHNHNVIENPVDVHSISETNINVEAGHGHSGQIISQPPEKIVQIVEVPKWKVVHVPQVINRPYPVPQPFAQPVPVVVNRPILVPQPVPQPYPVHIPGPSVERPVPVGVPVQVPVPQPVPVPIQVQVPIFRPQPIPYPVHVPGPAIAVPHPVPVPVRVPVPYPVHVPGQTITIPRPVPVPVQVQVRVPVPVPVPFPVQIPVPNPQPIPYPIEVPGPSITIPRPVPIPIPQPFPVPQPQPYPQPYPVSNCQYGQCYQQVCDYC